MTGQHPEEEEQIQKFLHHGSDASTDNPWKSASIGDRVHSAYHVMGVRSGVVVGGGGGGSRIGVWRGSRVGVG